MKSPALPRRALMSAALLTLSALAASPASAQSKWDLPAAYPATNFHTENLVQFATDVEKLSGGKLRITVHPNASLFKAPEIKRAVQGGQAQLGRAGGKVTSPAKAAAARSNGAKGGRPRKTRQ